MEAFCVRRDRAELPGALEGDAAASPLVYLHGLSGFGSAARSEAPSGFRLATYDQRGHGDATPFTDPADYPIEEFVADAIAVLDHLGWTHAAVGGESMGAAVALRLALDHPDRISSLILAGPAFSDEPNTPLIETFDLVASGIDSVGIDGVIPLVRQAQIGRGFAEESTAHLDDWKRHDDEAFATVLRTVTRWVPFPRLDDDLRSLTCPVFVVGWPDDPFHPLALAERIAAATGAQLSRVASVEDVVRRQGTVSRAIDSLME